jgi:NADH-quinone oxidoreductase subunit G
MVTIKINNKSFEVEENITILEAAKFAGFDIPTLCHLKDINDSGACRVCVVEIEGDSRLSASCNTMVEEGMSIFTNSRRVRQARHVNVELMLAEHNSNCPSCIRSGNKSCALQTLSESLIIPDTPYVKKITEKEWPKEYPLWRDSSKCIKCMRCIMVCDKVQGIGVWDIQNSATRLTVGVKDGKHINESGCTLCGQCIRHCPVAALRVRSDSQKVFDAISNPDKIVVAQIAPAVRAAWAESTGLSRDIATVGRMVAAVRAMGVDYVFDTNFAADLTIMEEGSELLTRLKNRDDSKLSDETKFPLFTSCCPGWVRFVKLNYPELIPNLSTTKSPQQMFGAVAKTWFAKQIGVDSSKIFSVSIMPCSAKKLECTLPGMDSAGTGQDVDIVITSRELARMLRASHIDIVKLQEEDFDAPLGESTGAAVIFGNTGGVMDAALRTVYNNLTDCNPDPDEFIETRGTSDTRQITVQINDYLVRAAITSGLRNAREILEKIKSGEVEYDFVEVMACPGGCICGGGQPIDFNLEQPIKRANALYKLDDDAQVRFAHENHSIMKLYNELLENPLSDKSHEILHTTHYEEDRPPDIEGYRIW